MSLNFEAPLLPLKRLCKGLSAAVSTLLCLVTYQPVQEQLKQHAQLQAFCTLKHLALLLVEPYSSMA